MDLQKIYADSDFENAVVPAGQILVFNGLENGKPVTRCKDSSGNFGTLSGGGGGADVTLGQINADGNFQPLAFDGQTASNSGDPETVESYYGWNGTLPSPSGGITVIQGGDAVYYKCASVDTANKTWTGHKAVLTDGVYTFEETATTGLTYGTGFIPGLGEIYDSLATIKISELWEGADKPLTFTAEEAGSTVYLSEGTTATTSGILYRRNSSDDWSPYTCGTTVTLEQVGDVVQFMNTETTLNNANSVGNETSRFYMTGKISASGSIMSMLNFSEELSSNCFCGLFSQCGAALTKAPDLPAKKAQPYCYKNLFADCSSLQSVKIQLTDAVAYCVNQMLIRCNSLNVIDVAWTSWSDGHYDYVYKMGSASGTFYKPSALPEEFGDSRIPTGWTVVNKD